MSAPVSQGRRARLAYVYHPRSFPTFAITDAARELADLIWVVDRDDGETAAMLALLERVGSVVDVTGRSVVAAAEALAGCEPDGIVAMSDARLVWTAAVAELLSLPFHSSKTAHLLTDKHAQRAALCAGGLGVPGFVTVPDPDDDDGWREVESAIEFPAVLKPRIGEGSKDTFKVGDLAEARALAAETQGIRPGRELVLEEYLRDAPDEAPAGFAGYVSVECVASDGWISPVAVTGRFPLAEPFRETGFFIPGCLRPDQREAVVEVARRSAVALGIEIGCLHIEIKLTPDGPRVIEVNGRLGGGIPEMCQIATGVDLYDIALRVALGERIVFDSLFPCDRVGWLLYVHAPQWMSEVHQLAGLDALDGWPEVHEVVTNRGPGSKVSWQEGNHGHVYSVLGAAADHADLRHLEQRVHREVAIEGV